MLTKFVGNFSYININSSSPYENSLKQKELACGSENANYLTTWPSVKFNVKPNFWLPGGRSIDHPGSLWSCRVCLCVCLCVCLSTWRYHTLEHFITNRDIHQIEYTFKAYRPKMQDSRPNHSKDLIRFRRVCLPQEYMGIFSH